MSRSHSSLLRKPERENTRKRQPTAASTRVMMSPPRGAAYHSTASVDCLGSGFRKAEAASPRGAASVFQRITRTSLSEVADVQLFAVLDVVSARFERSVEARLAFLARLVLRADTGRDLQALEL